VKTTGRRFAVIITLSLLMTGCASVKPPASRDAFNDYVPHKEINAPAGSPDNPDTGWNSLMVALLQAALPPK
jgi:uncharacterized protein YceK